MDEFILLASEGIAAHTAGFFGLLIFSGAFYFVFAFFREQVCAIACPYGRLQGVLTDKKTIVVAYDYVRGEPRGPLNKVEGDCISCNSCVQVCPTGIDIRNGTQLECVNCTACIDACNSVMTRIKKPKGLIRYDSEEGIAKGLHHIFNPRSIAYSVVLTLLLFFVGFLFAFRGEFEATILRAKGSLYQEYGTDSISNIYNFNIVNKVRTPLEVDFKVESHHGNIKYLGEKVTVGKGEVGKGTFLVIIPVSELKGSKTPIIIGLYTNGDKVLDYESSFVGPNSLDK
jgi:cytochrome c oxidase accessory protein FixG